ncbi:HutD/Ves family protein [Lysobacter sp. A3-1-A15]|uniref:HutD/Ves family protein n=1 Tax=Novilysobacter viscosus TaxID=3098602 RepID=UPI002EDBAD02
MAHTTLSRVIPANEYRRVRWRNGQGWTREVHAQGEGEGEGERGGQAWAWRMSIAEIEQDSPFSVFPGVDRELTLLSGEGLRLRFDDGEGIEILPPHGRHRFAGERPVTGELLDGPSHGFNLMWRRGQVQADSWHRPLVGPMVIFAEPRSTWAVHLIAGQARFADDSGLPALEAGDTALLVAGDERLRHVLDGGGEALLMRLAPANQDLLPAAGWVTA